MKLPHSSMPVISFSSHQTPAGDPVVGNTTEAPALPVPLREKMGRGHGLFKLSRTRIRLDSWRILAALSRKIDNARDFLLPSVLKFS